MTDGGDRPAASAQPLLRPPTVSTGEDRSATPLELFFDLAYVLVVGELAATLLDDLTWHGAGRFAGLFVVLWLSWVGFTLYANRFDTDDAGFRGAKLLATLAVAGCAASAPEATGVHATEFAACYLLLRVVLVGLYLRAWVHVRQERAAVTVYLVATGGTALLWAVSLLVPPPARYVLWAVAAVVDVAGPVAATALRRSLPLHLEHLPERFGLLVILVLGEVVGAVVTGIHDQRWAARPVVLAILAFVAAGALWWSYFDVSADVSARRLQRAEDEEEAAAREGGGDGAGGDERHDLFVYGHLPLTLGVAAAGAGLEHLILHPDEALPSAAGWLACGGVALFFAGTLVLTGGAQRRWRGVLLWTVPPVAAVLLLAAAGPPVTVLLCGLATVCVAFAAAGMALTRRTPRDVVG
jgi:low temperature requirement protein LtrA